MRTGLSFLLLFLIFQVLKAIGLQRTGKQDEAFSLAQEVSVLEPTDDNSLQALTILYREMHRREYTRTRTRGGGRRRETSTFGTFPVIHSGVGGEAVRGRGEEGPPQRGVSLPPLHGLRPGGGVQEDAAGEKQSGSSKRPPSGCRDALRLKDVPFQAGMALYKIVPKNPYYFWSVMSLVMQVRSHACAWLPASRSPVANGRASFFFSA